MTTGSQLTFATSTSFGSMEYMGDGHLKGIVHFKLFIAVHAMNNLRSDTQTPSVEIAARESIGTDGEEETIVLVQVLDFVQHASHGAF